MWLVLQEKGGLKGWNGPQKKSAFFFLIPHGMAVPFCLQKAQGCSSLCSGHSSLSKERCITAINSSGHSEVICSGELHRVPAELETNPGLVCSLSCVPASPSALRAH